SSPSPNRHDFGLEHTVRGYPQALWPQLLRVLMEGWMWLEGEGFIAPDPGKTGDWYFITRKGQRYRTVADLRAYQEAARFRQEASAVAPSSAASLTARRSPRATVCWPGGWICRAPRGERPDEGDPSDR